jgi:hypothetical protein
MKLPEYMICQSTELNNPGLILHTKPPFYCGSIITHKHTPEHLGFIANYNGVHFSQVPGYNIAIVWAGTLVGNKVTIDQGTRARIKQVFDGMAEFFYTEKIETHKGYYQKFLKI